MMKKTVLIIEDDCDLASLFRIVMEMCGFEASIIHHGRQGMEALGGSNLPDVVMLDMHLPGVSGEEIYAMMKERGEGRRVLLCSADVQLVERYRTLGANAMTKPAAVDDLQKAVQEIAGGN
jgi:two-component system alkaline phosphatase synthesis response regulator PhoP